MSEYSYFSLRGGLDISTPAISVQNGMAMECVNFEPGINGGFRRIAGYERYDGRARPSDATFYAMRVVNPNVFTVGSDITNGTGSGHVIAIIDNRIFLTNVVGVFNQGDTINGTLVVTEAVERDALSDKESQDMQYLAAEFYRASIQAVPGDGPIRGVHHHIGTTYAWRDNGSTCKLYRASITGWTEVPLHKYVKFTAGTTEISAGDTIKNGAVEYTVHAVTIFNNNWVNQDAEGYIVFSGAGAGFNSGDTITLGVASAATASSDTKNVEFSTGSRFECVSTNFRGDVGGYRVYGANGKDPAFEITNDHVVVPIISKGFDDNPKFLSAYKNRLFLGFENGAVQFSVVGQPYSYEVALGAGEISLGANLTGLVPQPGGIVMTTSRQTFILEGSSVADFVLQTASESTGAKEYTMQPMSRIYALDDRGVISLDRTQAFGNFESATISRLIQKIVDAKRDIAIASCIVRYSNQYRIFFSDGTALAMYPLQTDKGLDFNATMLNYPNPVTCITNEEDDKGRERIFFGSDNGFVYEDHRGTSFDGEPIEAWVRLTFNHFKSPRVRKRWRKAVVELDGQGYIEMAVTPDISYSSPFVSGPMTTSIVASGGGGFWDTSGWDTFTWDSTVITTSDIKLFGTGINLGMLFHQYAKDTEPFTLQSMIVHYDQRRLER